MPSGSALPSSWRRLVDDEAAARHARTRMVRRVRGAPDLDESTSAQIAGLRYVNDAVPGIRRVGSKSRVRYVDPHGRTIGDAALIARIRSLAIPPAWRDVWICPDPRGHLQATGRDARGRKQYRYHPKWREVRDEVKYGRMLAFAKALPTIRRHTASDLRRKGLPREKVVATVVQLLEKTLIRVGNEEYARENRSFGLTTMRDRHVRPNRNGVRFEFRGKSGVSHKVELSDRRLAKVVKACRDLPGQELFQWVDDRGERHSLESGDVNGYLQEISGESFTAKDFRTWAGTVLIACELASLAAKGAAHKPTQRSVVRAVDTVARHLGNTRSVCRKSYVHPAVIDAYLAGQTIGINGKSAAPRKRGLSAQECAVVDLLRRRLRG